MSTTVKTFRDLIVWQKAMTLVTDVYRASSAFPASEQYGLTSQLRRCAVSIPSNIAEGFGRDSTNDYLRFLSIAAGSLYESQTQLEIARNLEFLAEQKFTQLLDQAREIERMLSGLIRSLKGQRDGEKGQRSIGPEGQREKAKGQRSIGPEGQRE